MPGGGSRRLRTGEGLAREAPAPAVGKVCQLAVAVRVLTAQTDNGESTDMQETEILSQERTLRE